MPIVAASPGVYFVRLLGDHLVSVNDSDAKRRNGCIKVNAANCKYGISVNLRARLTAYRRTFGVERVRFDVLVLDEQPARLERLLHAHFAPYRKLGQTGRLNEWLEGIDPNQAYAEAAAICRRTMIDGVELVPSNTVVVKAIKRSDAATVEPFLPEDICRAAEYLHRNGMTQELLSELHHFRRQTYKQTLDYFAGKSRIQGRNNPIYAARLDFVVKGHMRGIDFPDLVEQAKAAFPYPGADQSLS
ncbi:GIY-YIG nuclease family protein [Paracoccus sp. SSK6]|uniref:GIY-YIG nuclease family protein n=1 Tax=Paracoccus sp. SSK6 TaxID=3143131 RepID=UPI0032195CCC